MLPTAGSKEKWLLLCGPSSSSEDIQEQESSLGFLTLRKIEDLTDPSFALCSVKIPV